jgi:hypothetical protein
MDPTLVIALWLVCAFVCWYIAILKKAPDRNMWALVGLLLGPLGILLTAIFAKPKPAEG